MVILLICLLNILRLRKPLEKTMPFLTWVSRTEDFLPSASKKKIPQMTAQEVVCCLFVLFFFFFKTCNIYFIAIHSIFGNVGFSPDILEGPLANKWLLFFPVPLYKPSYEIKNFNQGLITAPSLPQIILLELCSL